MPFDKKNDATPTVEPSAKKGDANQLVASLQEHVRNGFGVTGAQLQEIADAL